MRTEKRAIEEADHAPFVLARSRFDPAGVTCAGNTPEVFRLAGIPKEIRAKGEIIRVMDRGNNIDFHVRFVELEVSSELAIAKYLDEVTR
jgi:hypothetical protein